MKIHTTNYYDTFIEIAEDSPVDFGNIPTSKSEKKTIAEMQFELISTHPYTYTSDDILFQLFARKQDLTESEFEESRKSFFSKGQACLRASPLPKKFGFGIHFNKEGKVAIFGADSTEYKNFSSDPSIKKLKAMRTSKK